MAGPTVRSTSTVSGTGTSIAIPYTAGVAINDLIYAEIQYNSRTTTITSPGALWVQIDSIKPSSAALTTVTYYHVINGKDIGGSTWTWTLSGSQNFEAFAVNIEAGTFDPVTPINAHNTADGGLSTSLVAPSVTTTVDNCLLICSFSDSNNFSLSTPTGMTSSSGLTGGLSGVVGRVAYLSLGAAGATATETSTLGGSAGAGNLSTSTAIAPNILGDTGPFVPTTITGTTGTGTGSWTNPTNAWVDDSSYATLSRSSGSGPSKLLAFSGWGEVVPTGATILGVAVTIVGKKSFLNGNTQNLVAQLAPGGTLAGSTKQASFVTTSDTTVTLGGSSDLWGTSLSDTDINDPTFTFTLLSNYNATAGGTQVWSIDAVTLEVWYSATQLVSPSGVSSAEAFGSATFVAGAVSFSPSGIATAEAFGSPTVVPLVYVLSATGIGSAEAFGAPTFIQGIIILFPSGIDSAEAFGSPTLVPGMVAFQPPGIGTGESFGSATVTSIYYLLPTGVDSEEAFGAPIVLPGAAILLPSAIASAEALGSPTLYSFFLISPDGIVSGEAFGLPEFFDRWIVTGDLQLISTFVGALSLVESGVQTVLLVPQDLAANIITRRN